MLMVEDVDLTPNPHALKFILNEKITKSGNKTIFEQRRSRK